MADPMQPLFARRAEEKLLALVRDEPVVALHGPRSVGKSTLLRSFAARQGVDVIDLDDLVVREAVAASPSLVSSSPTPICIDEYQYVPEVLDAIKAKLNREGVRPSVAVITGSTRQDAVPMSAQALTGRLHSFDVLPLSQGEIGGVREEIIPHLRTDAAATVAARPISSVTRTGYAARITAGGFPLAIRRSGAARNRWFDDYVRLSTQRDAQALGSVGKRQALSGLLSLLAARTGQVLNVANVAAELQLHRGTAESYLRLLEDLFLVFRLPAWGTTLSARATASPKVHVVDAGLAARLLRVTAANLASLDPSSLTEFGHLLETFVVGELKKQSSWLDEPVLMGHWRTSDGDEVDAVLEFEDGSVIAFEVKAGERVSGREFRALKKLQERLGRRFVAGVVLSLGSRSYTYEEGLHVMPVERLWQPVSATGP